MSEDDEDARALAALGRALPAVDLDAQTGEQIARRARMDVGKGVSKRRWILPLIAALLSLSFLGWTLLRVLEIYD